MRRRDFVTLAGGMALPLTVRAQQTRPVVGFVSSAPVEQGSSGLRLFRLGLGDGGYAEGRNVQIEFRWADGYDRLQEIMTDLVQRKVVVIVAAGGVPVAKAAMAATNTVPIVFNVGGDPVTFGIVPSLNRPGGNITGVTNFNFELGTKRLELLHEMAPLVTRIALLVNPATPLAEPMAQQIDAAARAMGLALHVVRGSTEKEIGEAFANIAQAGDQALIVGADAYFAAKSRQLAALAGRDAIATVGSFSDFAKAGGLMSYGANLAEQWRLVGLYTARVLSGDKPAELPVLQSTKVEFIINLKTARALGLSPPVALLGRADEVIE